jgi:hypothetical protein
MIMITFQKLFSVCPWSYIFAPLVSVELAARTLMLARKHSQHGECFFIIIPNKLDWFASRSSIHSIKHFFQNIAKVM